VNPSASGDVQEREVRVLGMVVVVVVAKRNHPRKRANAVKSNLVAMAGEGRNPENEYKHLSSPARVVFPIGRRRHWRQHKK